MSNLNVDCHTGHYGRTHRVGFVHTAARIGLGHGEPIEGQVPVEAAQLERVYGRVVHGECVVIDGLYDRHGGRVRVARYWIQQRLEPAFIPMHLS